MRAAIVIHAHRAQRDAAVHAPAGMQRRQFSDQVGRGEIGPGRGEDQPEERRAFQGELQIAKACAHRFFTRVRSTHFARVKRVLKTVEPFRRQRGQKPARVADVVRRGRVADPGPLGNRAKREPLDALFGQLSLCSRKQSRPQIAMVIGFFCHVQGLAVHLSTVKIFLDGAPFAP